MTCLKCGRETDQTFCENCREVMERYPVRSGAIIYIPKERSAPPVKRNVVRRPTVSPEAQIEALKKTIRRLSAVVASLLVLLAAMGYALQRSINQNKARPVGQNYSTVTRATTENQTAPTEDAPAEDAH